MEEIKSTDFDGDQNSNEVNGFTLTESNGVISNLVDINTDTNQLKDKSISLTSRDKTASEEIPNRANNISQHSLGKSAHCHICGKSYSDNAHLKCHIRKVHNKKYSCHICLRLFTKSQELVAHQSVNTGHKQFQCSTCGKQYSHKGSLREHMHSHSGGQGPLTCEICEQRFPSTKSLKYHVKDKHKIKDQKCGICGKSFFGKGSLTSHMIWHTNERLYTCDICNRKFMTKPSIRKHVVRHFGGLLDGPGMTFVSCDFCGRKYQNKKLLQEHMRSHTAEIGGICEICGFMAATRATLKNHLDGHLELGERKKKKTVVYECNICHKKYAQASSLEVHKRIHANIRRYCCSICNKQFVQSHSLTVHMRVHNGSKPYRCYICGAQYTQSYPLTLHKRKKHPETIAKS